MLVNTLKGLPLLRRQRLVWSDSAVVNDLLKKGLFMRIYEPQVREGSMEREGAADVAHASEAWEVLTRVLSCAALLSFHATVQVCAKQRTVLLAHSY